MVLELEVGDIIESIISYYGGDYYNVVGKANNNQYLVINIRTGEQFEVYGSSYVFRKLTKIEQVLFLKGGVDYEN